MTDRLTDYQRALEPLPARNRLWPLYGAGMPNLGRDAHTIDVPLPSFGPDELLVRHDACGLCFSDIKLIRLGQEHPRIRRDMRADPVVMGHEVSMTVVGVGENLRDQYRAGDRFIIQADIYVDGVNLAYGYEIQGGLSQYNAIDHRVLSGDHGNYLIPVQPDTGYAEAALTEPWACVIASYQLTYRTGLKPGGTAWIIGTNAARDLPFTIGAGLDPVSHPGRLLLTAVPPPFAAWLEAQAASLGIAVEKVDCIAAPSLGPVDDLVVLGADPQVVQAASPHLADWGILAIVADAPLPHTVAVDVGRVHYNHWLYIGGPGPDIAQVYSALPTRSALRPGGRAWFVGAGGPMGRMHVQRAIQATHPPVTIVCTDVSDLRLDDLCSSFGAEAEARGIQFVCLNPTRREAYQAGMAAFQAGGLDDIVILAPIAAVIADAAAHLAPQGVMNIFAGVARGTMAHLDLSDVYLKGVRVIGHSASTIADLRLMLHKAETGELSPNRSVAAIGSLSAAWDGLQAVQDTLYPGKIVIYPQILEMPLTALTDLRDVLPGVYAGLKGGREWTVEAEQEFLRLMLP